MSSLSAPFTLPPVASRCLPLLLPPAGPWWRRFRLRSRCLPLPPVAFASCWFPVASLSAPLSLPPVASRCFCSNFFGAARASFLSTFHSRMKSWPQSSIKITGRRGPPRRPLDPFQCSFQITGRRGGRAEGEAPEAPSFILFNFPLSVLGSMPV